MCLLNAQGRGVAAGVVVPTAATIEKETFFTKVKLETVSKDMQEVKKLVELLVRRVWCPGKMCCSHQLNWAVYAWFMRAPVRQRSSVKPLQMAPSDGC